jgi:hypothetical protein
VTRTRYSQSNLDPADWRLDVADLDHLASRFEYLRSCDSEEDIHLDPEEAVELGELERLDRQLRRQTGGGLAERDGHEPALVWEGHFVAHVKGEQQGGIDATAWPFCCIDWDKAAAHVRPEYVEVQAGGRTWLVRAA